MSKMKDSSSNTNSRTGNWLTKLSEKCRSCDKSVLISFVTACVFILLGLVQLVSVIFYPSARSFDRFSLVIVDFIISAFCFVYVLSRQGKINSQSLEKLAEIVADPEKDPESESAGSGVSRIIIPSSKMNSHSVSARSKSRSDNARKRSGIDAENENSFSPRHRYSDGTSQRREYTAGSALSVNNKTTGRHTNS